MKRVAIAFLLMLVALSLGAETRPAVARMWRGRVPRARADEYQKYLEEAGITKLRAIKDNLGVDVFRRDEGDATEFVVISYWPNRDAIHAYAGADIEKVHELPRDKEFLLDAPGTLKHYDIIQSPPPPPKRAWKNADPAVDCAGASDKALCARLLAMRDRDQQARYAVIGQDDTPDIRKIDTENLAQLDAIVAARGFPTKALVGMKGVVSARTIDTLPQADAAAEAQYFQPSWSDRRLACRRAIREIVDRRGRLSLHEGWQKLSSQENRDTAPVPLRAKS